MLYVLVPPAPWALRKPYLYHCVQTSWIPVICSKTTDFCCVRIKYPFFPCIFLNINCMEIMKLFIYKKFYKSVFLLTIVLWHIVMVSDIMDPSHLCSKTTDFYCVLMKCPFFPWILLNINCVEIMKLLIYKKFYKFVFILTIVLWYTVMVSHSD
jgi:hypothetical protein